MYGCEPERWINNLQIHKFELFGQHVLLDINSGTVHLIDKMTSDALDYYDGHNAEETVNALTGRYDEAETRELLGELDDLIKNGLLFAPELSVPETLKAEPVVKSICLHVAHDCNLRCKYCFAETGDFGGGRSLMSREVGEKAIELLIEGSKNRRTLEVDFFGGEPLVNKPVTWDLIRYARRREKETGKNFKLTLTTNGMLLDDEAIAFLNEQHVMLVLSLDGRKEVHDRMRPDAGKHGSYDRVVAAFRKLIASRHDKNYFLRGTYTRWNLDFAADVLDLASIGSQVSVEPVVSTSGDYALREEDLPVLFAEYEKLAKLYLAARHSDKPFEFFHFNLDLNHGPCVAKRLAGCGAGHEYFAVTPEGDLYPCHQFVGREDYKLGTVFEGVTNKELPGKFRAAHVLNKPTCRTCWARYYCSGGCHANAELFTGDILKPYKLGCELQKKRLECAIWIQALLLAESYQWDEEKKFHNFDYRE